MASPFSKVRAPDRWTQIEKEFVHGAHWLHVVQHLTSVVLFNVNDACRDLNIRYVPKLAMTGKPDAVTRSLTVTCRNIVRTRVTVKLDPTGILLGENYICLDSEGAVTRLAHAMIDIVEKTWHSDGH